MILNCNSCSKKFVVPDSAISASGRMVQCGSCGLKWKQFPVNEINNTKPISNIKKIASEPKQVQPKRLKAKKVKKVKKTSVRKSREINLYSPEYLAKKHGINLNETNYKPKPVAKNKVSFGFYGSLIILLVFVIAFSRILYFFQDFIITKLPFTEIYLKYFFESIRNLFEIWKSLISNY